jgi:hypothetical protein
MKVAHALAPREQDAVSQHAGMNISGDESMEVEMQILAIQEVTR